MKKTYSGKYTVQNPKKYKGDCSNVQYRSGWEKYVMKFLDTNTDIIAWNSEEVVVPYLYEVDQKYHRYFCDFYFETKGGDKVLVEVKPAKETRPPTGARKTKRYIQEGYQYVKNKNKWTAAEKYAKERGWKFVIWTEHELWAQGIMPKSTKPMKKMKPYPKYRKKKAK